MSHGKHVRKRSKLRPTLSAIVAGTVGIGMALAISGVVSSAPSVQTGNSTVVLGDNGPSVDISCNDPSAALELRPRGADKANITCFNPYATTTTTTPSSTTTTTSPPTTTTVPPTTTTVPPTTTTTTQPGTQKLVLGSYNWANNPNGATLFAMETNTKASIYSDYLAGDSMCNGGAPYPLPQLNGHLGSMRLNISVPLPDVPGMPGLSGQNRLTYWTNNQAGWNACMQTMEQTLVSDGFSNAIIRLMWEPDSGIYSSGDQTSASNYATLWREAVTKGNSISGQAFQWDWYYGVNFDSATNSTAWPGSQYVTHVTFDQYDQSWNGSCGVPYNGSNWSPTQSQCIWDNDISKGLARVTGFAASVGKTVSIGEWGVINRGDGHGGGDDPTFVNNFTNWLKAHVVWASYFNVNSGGNSVLSDYPNSLSTFKVDLGGF